MCGLLNSRTKISFVLVLLIALVLAGAASAQSRTQAESTWAKEATKLLEQYRPQFDAVDHNTLEGRELFVALQDELADALSALRGAAFPVTKGAADCATACNFANSGKVHAALAKVYADTAAASSDPDCTSVYTSDAQLFAGLASATADFAAPFACGSPKQAQTAQDLLESAERRANKTYINAWYSNLNGCSASAATLAPAQAARDDFYNGAFYAGQCN